MLAAAATAFALTACATTSEPRIVEKIVKVPVSVPCAADPGPNPTYPDTREALQAAPDIFTKVQILLAARSLRIAREAELIAANEGCR